MQGARQGATDDLRAIGLVGLVNRAIMIYAGFAADWPCSKKTAAGRALIFRAESAHDPHDEADQENQAQAAAAQGGAAKVKSAAAEQKQENN